MDRIEGYIRKCLLHTQNVYVYIVNGKNPKVIMPMRDVCGSTAETLDLTAQLNFKSVYGRCSFG